MIIENRKYFIAQIGSSKACQFTRQYHYTGTAFPKAKINLGIFNKDTKELVGVLQWGVSAQENIRLDRFVKQPIHKSQYLELNRFCMTNDEERNSESQAISLGIKWIKRNLPKVKLLVSYAGRKEGNYGYIYQATNWEYLGYFISPGFWSVDGEERHLLTLYQRVKKHGNQSISFTNNLKLMYHDIRQTWTKQFIYIYRLDKKLTPARYILPYPKADMDYPIKVKEKVVKRDEEFLSKVLALKKKKELGNTEYKHFYYEENEPLFSRAALIRQGKIQPKPHTIAEQLDFVRFARYSLSGKRECVYNDLKEATETSEYSKEGIIKSLKEQCTYKSKYFRGFHEHEEIPMQLNVFKLCKIDDTIFYTAREITDKFGISKQAVSQAKMRRAKTLAGHKVEWFI